ncbi:MAG: hypothetical protein ACKOPP_00185, partial [Bacteroidota bacterium]
MFNKPIAGGSAAMVYQNLAALRSTAPSAWRSVLEHANYPEGEWVQVALAPAAVWVYVLQEQKNRYGVDAQNRRMEA